MHRVKARVWMVAAMVGGAGAGIAALSPSASAQNALGDGRALDANLRVGSGGVNLPTRDFRTELEFRNALVTGNVAGGMAFRGEVGYTAANDFRGNTAGDDIFEFERESFYSNLAARNLSGLGGLQSSMAYSVAGQSSSYFGGQLIINRAGSAVSAGEVTGQNSGLTRVDVYGNLAGAMRSPSAQTLRQAEVADLVAYSQPDKEGNALVISASSLLGVKIVPTTSIVVNAGKRTETEPLPGMNVEQGQEQDDEEEAPINPLAVSPHQRVLNALRGEPLRVEATREATLAAPDRALDQEQPTEVAQGAEGQEAYPELDRLRELLDRGRAIEVFGRSLPGTTPDETTEQEGSPSGEAAQPEEKKDGKEDQEDVGRLAKELLGVELPPIDHLMNPDTSNRVFRRHMARGEALLGEGRWFEAEERFTSALAIIPGDPMAAAGRVHAQLGAGMYLSATVNLRNLLRAYPEFIPVRFDEKLLPRGDRLDLLKRQLRQRMERDTPVGRDAAFLLAYVGHQYGDQALVREGFDALDRIETALAIEPDPLHEALRAVWLQEGSE